MDEPDAEQPPAWVWSYNNVRFTTASACYDAVCQAKQRGRVGYWNKLSVVLDEAASEVHIGFRV